MVADEHVDGDARVSELGQFALQTDKASRNHSLILEPEVEQVTHQVELLAVGTDAIEETQQLALALLAVFD